MQDSLPPSSFARPAAPLLPLRHRHARLEADRLTKICLRECSWPPIRSGSGSGRRVRPPRAGYSTSAPCPLENLVPSYLYFLFDTVFPMSGLETHGAFAAHTPTGIQKKA